MKLNCRTIGKKQRKLRVVWGPTFVLNIPGISLQIKPSDSGKQQMSLNQEVHKYRELVTTSNGREEGGTGHKH